MQKVFEKFSYANTYKKGVERISGTIHAMKKEGCKTIINMYAQCTPGKPNKDETKEMRLKWFKQCLIDVEKLKLGTIAIPYRIGCGLAGGDWENYKAALEESKLDIVVYKNE